jgi:hypothetical protein
MNDSDAMLRATINEISAVRDEMERATNALPAPASRAALDAEVEFGALPVVFAGQAVSLASDHFLTILAVHREVQVIPVFATMTLVRSVFEACCRARWLVDSAVTRTERATRGAVCQADALEEQRKFFVATKAEVFDIAAVTKASDDFQAQMVAQGLNPVSRIDTTRLFDDHGPGQWMWRLTSGYAHGSEWAMTSGLKVESMVEQEGIRAGQTRMQIAADRQQLEMILRVALKYGILAHNEFAAYLGGYGPATPEAQ